MNHICRIIKARIDTYSDVRSKMRRMETFEGNSTRAEWEQGEHGKEYVVYSYNTPIVKVGEDRKILYYDAKRYSNTTTKLQEIIRVVFPKTHPTMFTNLED